MKKDTFSRFLQDPDFTRYTTVPAVQFLVDTDYPLLFFACLIKKLRTLIHVQIVGIDLQNVTRAQLLSQLETSFLGQRMLYWFKHSADVPNREREFWHEYIRTYNGPHCIWMCTPKKTAAIRNGVQVDIPSAVVHDDIIHMYTLFENKDSSQIVPTLRVQRMQLSVDTACLFLRYVSLLGIGSASLVQSLLERIVPPEQSLFNLSSAIFARKPQHLYAVWKELYQSYSPQFWCSYFSEVIWRAAQYVRYAHAGDMVAARAIAYRLPFSFTRSDWRYYSYGTLTKAHKLLCTIDFRLKNGGSYELFDLFLIHFMCGDI